MSTHVSGLTSEVVLEISLFMSKFHKVSQLLFCVDLLVMFTNKLRIDKFVSF
jgi:hypothetical protein